MKKAILLVVGALAGLYAIAGLILFIQTLLSSDPSSVRGGTEIAASVVPPCFGLVISLTCFERAFRKV